MKKVTSSKNMKMKIVFIVGVFICIPSLVWSAMTSTSYLIISDTFSSGGVFTSSTNYTADLTVGESPIGIVEGDSYELKSGFQFIEVEGISLSISSSSLGLGELSTSNVSVATTTVSISTDSSSGYTLSINSVSGTSITNVSDNSVTAGSEEYGLGLSGDDKYFTGDKSVEARILATYNGVAYSRSTDLGFKASISNTTTAGNYSQTIVLSVSVNP